MTGTDKPHKPQRRAEEPPRVEALRLKLIKEIPRFPNTRASLQHMKQKTLPDVLIDYVNWRSRYVGTRTRTVTIEPTADSDPRWRRLSTAIGAFLDKVRRGDDLTPHLSIAPHTRGYALAANAPGATNADRWSDKDLVLNIMGYHHFHMGMELEHRGHIARTNDLVFAKVGRDTFKVIAIFDHDVFESESTERSRLRTVHSDIISRTLPPGSVFLASDITTSGHNGRVVRYALQCVRYIQTVDPQIDDSEHVKDWFSRVGLTPPMRPNFEWMFHHLDLGFFEKITKTVFWVQRGWD